MDIVIPIGIYCYFGFDLAGKVAKFSTHQTQSAINAIQYVRNLPKKTFAKRFSQDIFPSSVGIGCKGTENLRDVQENSTFFVIFSLEDAQYPNDIHLIPHDVCVIGDPVAIDIDKEEGERRTRRAHRGYSR